MRINIGRTGFNGPESENLYAVATYESLVWLIRLACNNYFKLLAEKPFSFCKFLTKYLLSKISVYSLSVFTEQHIYVTNRSAEEKTFSDEIIYGVINFVRMDQDLDSIKN